MTRHLGTRDVVVFYVTSILGVGILIVPAVAYDAAGPASIVAWLLLVLTSWPIAASFAAMAVAHPEQSGLAGFIGRVWGRRAGQTALLILCLTMVVGNPIMGIAAARYLDHIVPLGSEMGVLSVGFIFMLISVLFNLLEIRVGVRLQTGLIAILLTILILASLIALARFRLEALTPFQPRGLAGVGIALTIGFYSFLGWENVNAIASDVRRPEHTFARAIPASLLIVGSIYLMVVFAFVGVANSGRSGTVLATLLSATGSSVAPLIGDLTAIFLIIAATNAWVLGASRLLCALGEQSLAPAMLGRRTGRGVPLVALLALLACYAVTISAMMLFKLRERGLIFVTDLTFFSIYLLSFSAACRQFRGITRWWAALSLAVIVALVIAAIWSAAKTMLG